jgi:Mlc titration factor MtfA (ptsG expression regulator)
MLRHHPQADPAWEQQAGAMVRRWQHLGPDETGRLLEQARTLDRTRHWEGLDSLEITPAMRARIAVGACLLTVNVGLDLLSDVTAIVVAPTSHVRSIRQTVGGSMVRESDACLLGEALLHGPVRIAWDRVEQETAGGSTSVVIHEFAHKVDMADGVANGTPPIGPRKRAQHFDQALDQAWARLGDGESAFPLRPYAMTNRAEMFAVATEAFFLRPSDLEARFRDLFLALSDFYRQDPRHGGQVGT